VTRPLLFALLLVGCLPDAPIDDTELPTTLVELGGDALYLDFADGVVDGADGGWDLRLDGWNLFLNGGESGPGLAGGIDMELLDLNLRFEEMRRRNQVIWFVFFDSYACALSDWWWYALDGTHTLFSNYHPYVVRTAAGDFLVQMLDYYAVVDNVAVAGWPRFRWARVPEDPQDPLAPVIDQIDATAGGLGAGPDDPTNRWTYFSFADGVLDLSDEESLASSAWDLGFKRFNIKSNSGPSGPAGVVTADADPQRGEQPDDVLGFDAANQEPYFLEQAAAWQADPTAAFREDDVLPVLRRWYSGTPGDGDVALVDGRWFLANDRTGEALLKLRVVSIEGDDPEGPARIGLEYGFIP
jgi:hypothetical protein